MGLLHRAQLFVRRVGGVIMLLTIALWFLASFPQAPEGATHAAIEYSFAGMLGHALEFVLAPIGFNWQISIALIPGMAAREVAISALGTVYALSATGPAGAETLGPLLAQQWSLPTAMAMLAWYVFAPQCISTIATLKRESGSWVIPGIATAYLFVLAYLAAFIAYRFTLALS
jgi:ferrous iron transport protein B